jgi:hypothetical protein
VNRRIIVEKTLDLVLGHEFQISAMFRKLGRGPVLSLKGVYYLALVIEFYANMANKRHSNLKTVDTIAKGIPTHSNLKKVRVNHNVQEMVEKLNMTLIRGRKDS